MSVFLRESFQWVKADSSAYSRQKNSKWVFSNKLHTGNPETRSAIITIGFVFTEQVMVFANRTNIHWVNQNTREHHVMPLEGITEAKYVDYDPVENMVYWSDVHHGGSISRATLCAEGRYLVNLFTACIVKLVWNIFNW